MKRHTKISTTRTLSCSDLTGVIGGSGWLDIAIAISNRIDSEPPSYGDEVDNSSRGSGGAGTGGGGDTLPPATRQ